MKIDTNRITISLIFPKSSPFAALTIKDAYLELFVVVFSSPREGYREETDSALVRG